MCKVFTSCLGTAAVWFVDVNRYCSFWVGVGGVMVGLGGTLGVGGLSPMKMMSGLVDLGGSFVGCEFGAFPKVLPVFA